MNGPHRPFSVTITAAGVFLLGMWNAWRTLVLVEQSTLLLQLGVSLNPYVRLVMAAIWSLLFVILSIALWQRRSLVRRLLPFSLLLYALYHLSLSALFVPTASARLGWQTELILYAASIVWVTWVLYRPVHHTYWRQTESDGMRTYPFSPFTVVQRGDDGESKD